MAAVKLGPPPANLRTASAEPVKPAAKVRTSSAKTRSQRQTPRIRPAQIPSAAVNPSSDATIPRTTSADPSHPEGSYAQSRRSVFFHNASSDQCPGVFIPTDQVDTLIEGLRANIDCKRDLPD